VCFDPLLSADNDRSCEQRSRLDAESGQSFATYARFEPAAGITRFPRVHRDRDDIAIARFAIARAPANHKPSGATKRAAL